MTDTEAATLVARIKHTWRGGPHVDVWRDVLRELDAGTAGTTIVRLARDLDESPSVAAFLRAYRSLDTPANRPVPGPPPAPRCSNCLGILDAETYRPTGFGCPHCRVPDFETGRAILEAARLIQASDTCGVASP